MKVLFFLGDRAFKFVIDYQYYSNDLKLEIRDFYLHVLSLLIIKKLFVVYGWITQKY